jgi:hypothetical protein
LLNPNQHRWCAVGFVVDGEMTACTQYYSDCFVPTLPARKADIQHRILAFHHETKHLIPLAHYTIDYAVDPTLHKIWIVEINNPVCSSRSSLFRGSNVRLSTSLLLAFDREASDCRAGAIRLHD